MTSEQLEAIKARYERMVVMVDENPSAASHACAISYSLDVPVLIAEVERLRERVRPGVIHMQGQEGADP